MCWVFFPNLGGFFFDQTLSMEQHASAITKSCFHQIRNIEKIRSYITVDAYKTLVCSLVASRMDYNTEENSEKIWKLWKKDKLNSEKIWKIQKKIVKWYGKYGWNVKYGKYGRKVSWIAKRFGKYKKKIVIISHFIRISHIISQFSSVFSKSIHHSTYFSSIFSITFHILSIFSIPLEKSVE
jgi:hypothetical protein